MVFTVYNYGWSTYPPQRTRNKALLRAYYYPLVSLNKALLNPYFWGGTLGGRRLTNHGITGQKTKKVCIFLFLLAFVRDCNECPLLDDLKTKGALTDEFQTHQFHSPVSLMFIGGHVYNKACVLKGGGFCFLSMGYTLPKTNLTPKNGPSQKETIVFEPSSFRGVCC